MHNMKKPPLDKLVGILVGLGVPGLVLLVAVAAAGVTGGAAIVVALAALGGPFGMLGGIAVLGILVLISKGLAEYGFEVIFKQVLQGLKKKGMSKAEILAKIESYPISFEMKAKSRDYVEKFWGEEKR